MFTYEQIPFTRIMAKKALSEGKISQTKYDELMSLLEKMEQDRIKIEEQSIKTARKILRDRQIPIYT